MDKEEAKKEALEFLKEHRKAVVAVVGKENEPSTSLMLYVPNDDFCIYVGTRKSFGKYKALQAHPKVALTVVEEALDPLRAVDVYGDVEFVPEEETEEMLKWFEEKNQSKYYVKDSPDFVMVKIKPYKVKYLNARTGDLSITEIEM